MFFSRTGKKWALTAATEVGRIRLINQDNFYVMEELRRHEELSHYTVKKEGSWPLLCAICDGMGGGAKGEEASFLALEIIKKQDIEILYTYTADALAQKIEACLQEVNDAVFFHFMGEKTFAGCTITLLYADKNRTLVANVGDSPCVLIRGQGYQIITVSDNRANQLYMMGKLTEAERWTDRTKNQLTQFLGMDSSVATISPHIYLGNPISKGECYLLASDGLFDHAGLEGIVKAVQAGRGGNLAEVLVEAALNGGSRDNITAITVGRRR